MMNVTITDSWDILVPNGSDYIPHYGGLKSSATPFVIPEDICRGSRNTDMDSLLRH
jgi:hypothetical protein